MSRQRSGGYAGSRARAKSEYRRANFLCVGCGKKICRCLSLIGSTKDKNICCEVPMNLMTPGEIANGIKSVIPVSWIDRRAIRARSRLSFLQYKKQGLSYEEAREQLMASSYSKVMVPTRKEYEAM